MKVLSIFFLASLSTQLFAKSPICQIIKDGEAVKEYDMYKYTVKGLYGLEDRVDGNRFIIRSTAKNELTLIILRQPTDAEIKAHADEVGTNDVALSEKKVAQAQIAAEGSIIAGSVEAPEQSLKISCTTKKSDLLPLKKEAPKEETETFEE